MKQTQDNEKLSLWKDRLSTNEADVNFEAIEFREKTYNGSSKLYSLVSNEASTTANHIRNIAAELIESQVNSAIPQPKITARCRQDEEKAKLIEDMIRNELDRMPMEEINDMMERTVPMQGGGYYLVEWDNTKRTHSTVGEIVITAIHPKMVIPQTGIFTSIEDMDYFILRIPQTKEYIKLKYGVDVFDDVEENPELKGLDESTANSGELVTQCIAYYKNKNGGIGLFSWVCSTVIEDIEDYQARRLKKCSNCGATENTITQPLTEQTTDGTKPTEEVKPKEKNVCAYCGGNKFVEAEQEYEEVYNPITKSNGGIISEGASQSLQGAGEFDENGVELTEAVYTPTKIPYYKPNLYPIVLQKNVSVYGQLLGDSDIDKIAYQQNTTNRLEKKIIDKLVKAGSYITLPDDATINTNNDDIQVIRPGSVANKSLIDVYTLEGNISQDLTYLDQVYQEARQIIGITDSFQGRRDTTATSGVAKQFAASQSAGRLESKRVLRDAAYAYLFELIFKYKLAYADEPRPVTADDIHGNREYKEFNRYDFLEMDDAGEYYWNDQFLFSTDSTAPLANNREAMWQETRMNLQTGAFGDPARYETLILFWTKMDELHYPGAKDTKNFIEEEYQKQQLQMQQQQEQLQMMQQHQMPQIGVVQPNGQQGQRNVPQDEGELQAILNKAKNDATNSKNR